MSKKNLMEAYIEMVKDVSGAVINDIDWVDVNDGFIMLGVGSTVHSYNVDHVRYYRTEVQK